MILSAFILLHLTIAEAKIHTGNSLVGRLIPNGFGQAFLSAGRKIKERAKIKPSTANIDAWHSMQYHDLTSLKLSDGRPFGELNGGWLNKAIKEGDTVTIHRMIGQSKLSPSSQDTILKYAIRVGKIESVGAVLGQSQSVDGLLSAVEYAAQVNPKAVDYLIHSFTSPKISFTDVPDYLPGISPVEEAMYRSKTISEIPGPNQELWKDIHSRINSYIKSQSIGKTILSSAEGLAGLGVVGAGIGVAAVLSSSNENEYYVNQ